MARTKNRVTEYRNYYLPLDFPVLLLSGEHWKISSVPSSNLHFHNCLEIGICHSESGYMKFNSGSKPLFFKEGDITCIPRNIPHTTYSSSGTESRWSYLFLDPQELFKNVAPSLMHNQNMPLSTYKYKEFKYIFSRENYPHIYETAMAAVREIEEKKAYYRTSAMGFLLSLLIEIDRVECEGGKNMPSSSQTNRLPDNAMVISPALDYIEDHYFEQFDIEYLAEICMLSPTHFRRLFQTIIETTPLGFLNFTRVMKACNLLRSTEYSILEISERVGFRSVSSFNRHFMEVMQTTPRDYRNETLLAKDNQDKPPIMKYSGWMYPEKIE